MKLPHHERYDYSAITRRANYDWPGGKRLAVYLGINIEHFAYGTGLGHSVTVEGPPPNSRTFAWRDYGNRVGVWRLFDLLDELGLPACHLINTTVLDYAPEISCRDQRAQATNTSAMAAPTPSGRGRCGKRTRRG